MIGQKDEKKQGMNFSGNRTFWGYCDAFEQDTLADYGFTKEKVESQTVVGILLGIAMSLVLFSVFQTEKKTAPSYP